MTYTIQIDSVQLVCIAIASGLVLLFLYILIGGVVAGLTARYFGGWENNTGIFDRVAAGVFWPVWLLLVVLWNVVLFPLGYVLFVPAVWLANKLGPKEKYVHTKDAR